MHSTRLRTLVAAGLLAALVVVCMALSLAVGARPIPLVTVGDALTGHASGPDAAVVLSSRLPRTVLGVLAGAALGVAGALMQAVTRNPLADPGLLGVNAGAGLAVVIASGLVGVHTTVGYVWFAFAGALAASVGVYLVAAGGRRSNDPARLTLAGVALGAVLLSLGQGLALLSPRAFDHLRAWQVGSLDVGSLEPAASIAPFIAVGLVIALASASGLNALAMGDDVARGLGVRAGRLRLLTVIAVALLAGAATAAAGAVGFVGLLVPHVVRRFVGPDQRSLIALSALTAPIVLLMADVVGRVVHRAEIPVGVMTALIGAPMLVAVARHPRLRAL